MKMKQRTGLAALIWVLLLVLPAGLALAQSESDEAPEDEAARPTPATATESGAGVVYTTDYLKEKFSEGEGGATPTVYTNESLRDREAEAAPPAAFTNEDLADRFGHDEPAEGELATGEVGEAETAVETEAPTAPDAVPAGGEPSMSREERARLVSEIDDELQRLEKRLLAIRNPLLAGTTPPSDEEAAEQAGLDNAERLHRTEAKIDELEATLEELRDETADPPRD